MSKAKPTFVVIQEGGTSEELYVHAHYTKDAAQADRIECAAGSYRTTKPVKIPPELAKLGEVFYTTVEAIIESLSTLDYPE